MTNFHSSPLQDTNDVDDKLTKDEIVEIVNECEYISDFLDIEGVDDIGESDDCDYEICNDNNDSNKYIWYDDELNDGTNNRYIDYEFIDKVFPIIKN